MSTPKLRAVHNNDETRFAGFTIAVPSVDWSIETVGMRASDIGDCEMLGDRAFALLIAAAPDLLAALEGARDELRLCREKDRAGPYDPTLRLRIDTAIRKARGA